MVVVFRRRDGWWIGLDVSRSFRVIVVQRHDCKIIRDDASNLLMQQFLPRADKNYENIEGESFQRSCVIKIFFEYFNLPEGAIEHVNFVLTSRSKRTSVALCSFKS